MEILFKMKHIIAGIFILNLQLAYAQVKHEYSIIDTIHTVIEIDSKSLVYYMTGEVSFCVFNEDLIIKQQNSIVAFETYLNSQEEIRDWQKKRLNQLHLMRDYLVEQHEIVITDPKTGIEEYNLKNPSTHEFTALHLGELFCPLLDEGKVQITYKGKYIDSYEKALVTEYDSYSSTKSVRYLIPEDSTTLLMCPPIVHTDYNVD